MKEVIEYLANFALLAVFLFAIKILIDSVRERHN